MGSVSFYPEEAPIHTVTVAPFAIERHPVTNAAFAEFVADTGYVTVAERPLDPALYPGVAAADLVPGALVFVPTAGPVDLNDWRQWWDWAPGAHWRQPFGVGTTRTVEIGSAVVEEVFFAWDEGARMAFRFDRTSLPVKAAIEDYRVVPTAEGCELVWRGKASAPLGLGWLIGRQLASGIRAGLPKLEALIAADPRRFGAD